MILDDLYAYYEMKPKADVLSSRSTPEEVCPRFWTVKGVSWELSLTTDGRLAGPPVPLGEKNKPQPRLLPDQSRSSGVCAYALADNATYVFGVAAEKDDAKKSARAAEARDAFQKRQHEVLDGVQDEGAQAFLAYIDAGLEGSCLSAGQIEELVESKGTIAFRLASDEPWRQIQCRPAVKEAWEHYSVQGGCDTDAEDTPCSGRCLVTGETESLARLFPQVTGVPGAQGAGASLVSFNCDSFVSYKQRSAAISEDAAYKCGEALRYLLKSDRHRMRIGNDTIVFWTDGDSPENLDALSLMLFAGDQAVAARKREDGNLLASIQRNLQKARAGLPLAGVDEDDRYHVLGIAPYQARLAVRFYEEGSLGDLRRNLETFLKDTEIVGVEPRSMRTYLQQVAPLGENSNIPSPLITSCMQALLRGTAFPASIFEQLLARMRADRATRNSWDMGQRAAMLKAYLVRRDRMRGIGDSDNEGRLTVALNEKNESIGYLLGRLFAVLEKVQVEAIGGGKASNINATIRDRYMASAATTPARVYPQLLKLAQHHVGKSEYGYASDRKIQEIIALMPDDPFPATLNYDQQGEFYIGYYQQKQDLYTSRAATADVADTIEHEEEN